MAVDGLYAQVVANLALLSELTGKNWDLLWFEQEFGYKIMCGSRVVGRASWISKVDDLISVEVIKHKPKTPKKKRRKPKSKPVIVLLWSGGLCILS
ncbi:MAG: hypothetical protein PHI31_16405 [Desulfuromonadaceae bacterium]|nr:hypothetical protein [Desulfuromonadaceae bacterium]